jgi:hypothetical protein
MIMRGDGVLKEATINGSGIEISSYIKEAMRGFGNNPTQYYFRFVIGMDRNLLDLVNDWDDKPKVSGPLLFVLGVGLGFLLSVVTSL